MGIVYTTGWNMNLLFVFLVLSAMSGEVHAGGKKKTVNTYITESWTERDYFGSGTHITLDKIRPNIYLQVHKVDGELNDLVGVPNGTQAGEGDFVDATVYGAYDRLNMLTRIDFARPIATRGYGDWSNDQRVWDIAKNYRDSSGNNLLELLPAMNGARGTRYRFIISVEDNTPFWFKNEGGPEMYFPYELIIFRITEQAGGTADANAFEETGINDELIVIRKDQDFRIRDMPGQYRLRNGRFMYNFTVYHQFKLATDYFLMVSARDIEDNERILKTPISMGQLEGIQLQNSNLSTVKDNN